MALEDLEVYQIALKISDLAWDIYVDLPKEFKYATNQQFLEAADSIGANISEGYGRYHYKDSKNFYYYARGSLYETSYWTGRLHKRCMLIGDNHNKMVKLLETEKIKLNNFINSIKPKA